MLLVKQKKIIVWKETETSDNMVANTRMMGSSFTVLSDSDLAAWLKIRTDKKI